MKCPMDDHAFLAEFEAAAIPKDRWTHRDHVRMAFLYLKDHSFTEALCRIRSGIQALNATHPVTESGSLGYHETVTVAWARLIRSAMGNDDHAASFDEVIGSNPQLLRKKLLADYYTADRVLCPEARSSFVDPDLSPLPDAPGSAAG